MADAQEMRRTTGVAMLIGRLNRWSARIGVGGALLIVLVNWRAWRRDCYRARLIQSREHQTAKLTATPRVSILVAAWNEADIITDHLRSFVRLGYPNKELVLCAGGTDGTHARASQLGGEDVIVLRQRPGEGKQRALQRCLEAASGEIIVLTDADSLLSDEGFQAVLAPIVNGQEAAATGTMKPLLSQQNSVFVRSRWFANLYVDSRRTEYADGMLGANAALRRDALEAVGAFRAVVSSGTDYHLAKRLRARGFRIRFVAKSVVETRYADDLAEELRRQTRWLRNVVTHGLQFGDLAAVGRSVIPPLIGIAMLAGPLAGLWLGRIAVVCWSLALTHALVSRARYLAFGTVVTGHPWRLDDIGLLPFLTVADFGIWALAFPRYLVKNWRTNW